MKKFKKSLLILMFTIIILFILTTLIYGAQIDPNDYETNGPDSSDMDGIMPVIGKIAGVIQVVGTIVSVGALMIIGIKYVIGSAEEKAEYKEKLLPYLVGAIMLFAASNLVSIIYNFFN